MPLPRFVDINDRHFRWRERQAQAQPPAEQPTREPSVSFSRVPPFFRYAVIPVARKL